MKTIIHKNTGLVHYCAESFDLKDDEIAIDALPTEPCEDETKAMYWDFTNEKFIIK